MIENQIRAALETLPACAAPVGLGGSGEKYILALTGEDPVALASAASAVEKRPAHHSRPGQHHFHREPDPPEIAVRPDFARAADLGVTSSAIAETLRVATLGDDDQSLAKLNLAQRQVPIVVKLEDSARKGHRPAPERLAVPGARGR